MRTAITSALALAALLLAAPAGAAGPLYSLPSTPTPDQTDSVDFANSLNKGVPGLPAALAPVAEPTPQQVENRARILERGVVIEAEPARGPGRRAEVLPLVDTSSVPGREPLLAAFLAAGALALAGLALAARRHRNGNGLRSAG